MGEMMILDTESLEILEAIRIRGYSAKPSDFAILNGAFSESSEGKKGIYWTSTKHSVSRYVDTVRVVFGEDFTDEGVVSNYVGIRPAYCLDGLDTKVPNNGLNARICEDGVIEIEYGYYPQKVAPPEIQKELSLCSEYELESMETGHVYSVSDKNVVKEIEYKGKRYVCLNANSWDVTSSSVMLENGQCFSKGDRVFVEVTPIVWLLDSTTGVMITKDIIATNIDFESSCNNIFRNHYSSSRI